MTRMVAGRTTRPSRIVWWLAGLMILVLGACVNQEDLIRLEARIAALEQAQANVARQIGAVDQRIDESAGAQGQRTQQIQVQYAETQVAVENLQTSLRQINGRIDEVEYNHSRRLLALDSAEKRRKGHLERIEAEIARNKDHIQRVQKYLNLEMSEAVLEEGAAGADSEGTPAPAEDFQQMEEDALYAAAKRAFDRQAFEMAREGFKTMLERFPQSENADNAQFWIGEIYFREQWYEKAILEYQKVIENYATGNKVQAALLKQGMAFFNLGDKTNARLILKELIRKYPKSREAGIAKQNIKGLE